VVFIILCFGPEVLGRPKLKKCLAELNFTKNNRKFKKKMSYKKKG